MLAIGMALAMKPTLLLLDEPTAGMSPDETRTTGEIVRSLSREGVTILVIEHDMAFVRQLRAPITVLHYGRVFAEGTFSEIEGHAEVRRIYLGSAPAESRSLNSEITARDIGIAEFFGRKTGNNRPFIHDEASPCGEPHEIDILLDEEC